MFCEHEFVDYSFRLMYEKASTYEFRGVGMLRQTPSIGKLVAWKQISMMLWIDLLLRKKRGFITLYCMWLNTPCGVAPSFPCFLDPFRQCGSVSIFFMSNIFTYFPPQFSVSCFVRSIDYTCAIQIFYYIPQPSSLGLSLLSRIPL